MHSLAKQLLIFGLTTCAAASPLALPVREPTSITSDLTSRDIVSSSLVLTRRKAPGPWQKGHTTKLHGPSPLGFLTVNLTIGSQSLEALFDTGSSDTWVIEKGFECVSPLDASKLPEAACNFSSSGYVPDKSFTVNPNAHLNTTYGGYYFSGPIGTSSVEFAGIKVPKQEIGLVNITNAAVDASISGILGFAFPALTEKFPGTDPSKDIRQLSTNPTANSNRITYSSIMNTMFFIDNLTCPVFSLALPRDRSNKSFGGLLSIGGPPDLSDPRVNVTNPSTLKNARIPIEIAKYQKIDPSKPDYQFYTISTSSLEYPNSPSNQNKTQFIVDSGTPLNYIPDTDAAAINALFTPAGKLTQGTFLVSCAAKPPSFGVRIAGTTFYTNPHDMIIDVGLGGGICASGVQPGGVPGSYVLGEVFLRNVLAVFDVGRKEMAFVAREFYAN